MRVKKIIRGLKDTVLQYEECEIRVRDATSNEAWGASGTLMSQIAADTYDRESYPRVFAMIWRRLNDYQHLQHVLKSLHLIDHLLRNGNPRFVTDVRARAKIINRLQRYKYYKDGLDIGGEVRKKSTSLLNFLVDQAAIDKARETAKRTRGKFGGYSNTSHQPAVVRNTGQKPVITNFSSAHDSFRPVSQTQNPNSELEEDKPRSRKPRKKDSRRNSLKKSKKSQSKPAKKIPKKTSKKQASTTDLDSAFEATFPEESSNFDEQLPSAAMGNSVDTDFLTGFDEPGEDWLQSLAPSAETESGYEHLDLLTTDTSVAQSGNFGDELSGFDPSSMIGSDDEGETKIYSDEADNVPEGQVKESKSVVKETIWDQDFVNLGDVTQSKQHQTVTRKKRSTGQKIREKMHGEAQQPTMSQLQDTQQSLDNLTLDDIPTKPKKKTKTFDAYGFPIDEAPQKKRTTSTKSLLPDPDEVNRSAQARKQPRNDPFAGFSPANEDFWR